MYDYTDDYFAEVYGDEWYASASVNKRIDYVIDYLNSKSNLQKSLDVLQLNNLNLDLLKYLYKELSRFDQKMDSVEF